MGAIFINYRRDDTAGEARALYKDLVAALGEGHVFMDVDNLALGMDFRDALDERLKSCDMMLALVGSGWLDANSDSGKRRLDDSGDFVRQEIAAALQRNIPVTPVLVQGARMPSEAELPKDLKSFAYRNGFELRHQRWDSDVDEMITRFGLSTGKSSTAGSGSPGAAAPVVAPKAAPKVAPKPKKRSWTAILATLTLAAGVAIGAYMYFTVDSVNPDPSPVDPSPADPSMVNPSTVNPPPDDGVPTDRNEPAPNPGNPIDPDDGVVPQDPPDPGPVRTSVTLETGVSDRFTVSDSDGLGFFRFTPGFTGFHAISVMSEPASVDHSWRISEDPAFATTIEDCDGDVPQPGTETCAVALMAGQEYSLEVENRAGEPAVFTIAIETPVVLSTGLSGGFSIRDLDGFGYFRFTPNATAFYEISVVSEPASVDHSWKISEDPAFATTIYDCDSDVPQPGTETCAVALTAGQDYDLAVENRAGEPAEFTVAIEPPVELGTGQFGWFSVRNSDGMSYFRFTPESTAVYEISVVSEPASVDHSWSISNDPAFATTNEDCDNDEPEPGTESCSVALMAEQDYNLGVENRAGEPAEFTITIRPSRQVDE